METITSFTSMWKVMNTYMMNPDLTRNTRGRYIYIFLIFLVILTLDVLEWGFLPNFSQFYYYLSPVWKFYICICSVVQCVTQQDKGDTRILLTRVFWYINIKQIHQRPPTPLILSFLFPPHTTNDHRSESFLGTIFSQVVRIMMVSFFTKHIFVQCIIVCSHSRYLDCKTQSRQEDGRKSSQSLIGS